MIYNKSEIKAIQNEIKFKSDNLLNVSEDDVKKYLCAKNNGHLPENFDLFSHCIEKAIYNGIFNVDFSETFSPVHKEYDIVFSKQSLNQKSDLLNFLQKHVFDNYRIYKMVAENENIPANIIVDNIDKTKWRKEVENSLFTTPMLIIPFLKREHIESALRHEIVEQLLKSSVKRVTGVMKNCSDKSRTIIEDLEISKLNFDNEYHPEWLIASIKTSQKFHSAYDRFLEYGQQEEILTAIANNEYFGTKRDIAFDIGVDIYDINLDVATEHMKEGIYLSCVDTLFDNGNLINENEKLRDMELLLHLIQKDVSASIQKDLLYRISSAHILPDERENIIISLAKHSENKNFLNSLISYAEYYFDFMYGKTYASFPESNFISALILNTFVDKVHSQKILEMSTIPYQYCSDKYCDGFIHHLSNLPIDVAVKILSDKINKYGSKTDGFFYEKILLNHNMSKKILQSIIEQKDKFVLPPQFVVLAKINLKFSDKYPDFCNNIIDVYRYFKNYTDIDLFDMLNNFSGKLGTIDKNDVKEINSFIEEQELYTNSLKENQNIKNKGSDSFRIDGFLSIFKNVANAVSGISEDVCNCCFASKKIHTNGTCSYNYFPDFFNDSFSHISRKTAVQNISGLSKTYFDFFCHTFDMFINKNKKVPYNKFDCMHDFSFYDKIMKISRIIDDVKTEKEKEAIAFDIEKHHICHEY